MIFKHLYVPMYVQVALSLSAGPMCEASAPTSAASTKDNNVCAECESFLSSGAHTGCFSVVSFLLSFASAVFDGSDASKVATAESRNTYLAKNRWLAAVLLSSRPFRRSRAETATKMSRARAENVCSLSNHTGGILWSPETQQWMS